MEPGTASQGRVTKRSPNACTRCRRQKIKCSGLQPCDSCSKRKLVCVFDGRDNKVLVTQGYLSDLQQKIAHLEEQQSRLYASSELSHEDHDGDAQVATPDASQHDSSTVVATQSDTHGDDPPMMKAQVLSPEAADLTNPLTVMPSTYMSASNGRTFYLGTSSNWSFSRKVLSLTHEHVYNEPLPTAALLFDGFAYDIGWDGSRSSPSPPDPVLPSPDHAIYLINAVKFHCGQLFHLFDEDDFMAGLHRFYSNSLDRPDSAGLWYIHFLTVLALGKSFTLQKNQGRKPSGANFIAKALHLLPDITFLCREPVEATEILCCIALYLQSLDFRNSADVFIGQAMRTAMGYGMNTDMPIRILGEHLVQRCRKIWWTVYILDRQMTSLMGNPSSISDDDVYCQLPTFAGSVQRTAALGMQVKLARVIAHINGTVYGSSGRLRKKFLTSTKAVLEGIARLADELRQTFPLHSEESFGGVSRMSAHLHILYHQCIVLATRPMLFCCLNMQYEAPSSMLQSFLAPPSKIRNLLTMCMESSIQILHILDGLQNQGLLEAFMPFDLDSLFMTTIVLLVGRVVDAQLLGSDPPAWLERAYALFDEMITRGNLVAEFRKTEVEKLASMMRLIGGGGGSRPTFPGSSDAAGIQAPQATVGSMLAQQHQTHQQEQLASNNTILAPPPPPTMPMTTMAATGISASLPSFYQDVTAPFHLDIGGADGGDGGDFTAEQIMAVANSIGGEDVEWISRAIIENSIWETE